MRSNYKNKFLAFRELKWEYSKTDKSNVATVETLLGTFKVEYFLPVEGAVLTLDGEEVMKDTSAPRLRRAAQDMVEQSLLMSYLKEVEVTFTVS
jgi:hypothetical protein